MSWPTLGYAGKQLTINTVTRKLRHYESDRLLREYPVAVGKPSTPTPPGHFKVINKTMHPGGVLGTRWMGLNITGGNYGIHGTNNPSSIGNAVSLGCVRMHNNHVEELFSQVPIGTPVHIHNSTVETANPGPDISSPVPPLNGQKTYTVQAGDTLWKIARRFNIPFDELISANSSIDPNRLTPGQVIRLP